MTLVSCAGPNDLSLCALLGVDGDVLIGQFGESIVPLATLMDRGTDIYDMPVHSHTICGRTGLFLAHLLVDHRRRNPSAMRPLTRRGDSASDGS